VEQAKDLLLKHPGQAVAKYMEASSLFREAAKLEPDPKMKRRLLGLEATSIRGAALAFQCAGDYAQAAEKYMEASDLYRQAADLAPNPVTKRWLLEWAARTQEDAKKSAGRYSPGNAV
jgi:tetratricopeptide (TPR) repeat protein